MRRSPMLALLCASALTALACGKANNNNSRPTRQLVLLHTNDEHSHLLGIAPEADDFPPGSGNGSIRGGVSRRLGVLSKERSDAAANGAATLTVSAGDNTMGTLFGVATATAAPDYRAMKLLGYDLTTLGNHEFDFGPAALASAMQVAAANGGMIPVVASNIHFSKPPTPPGDATLAKLFDETGKDDSKPMHRTYVILTSNGLKVGFVGIMGADAASLAPAKAPVTFSGPPALQETQLTDVLNQIAVEVQPLVDRLHNVENCDLVVALSHSGVNPSQPAVGEDYRLAQLIGGLDVIISGHSHTDQPAFLVHNLRDGRDVLVQQAGRYGDTVGRVAVSVDDRGKVTFDLTKAALIPVNESTPAADPNVNQFVAGILQALETSPVPAFGGLSFIQFALHEAFPTVPPGPAPTTVGSLAFSEIAASAFDVDNTKTHSETQLLTLAADAQLAAADAIGPTQLAVEASGAVRAAVLRRNKAGKLTFAEIFRAVPLGASPGRTARTGPPAVTATPPSPGSPLTRFVLVLAEIKAAFETVADLSYQDDNKGQFFLVPAGMRITFDRTRPPFNPAGSPLDPNNGRVTKIEMTSDHNNNVYETYGTTLFDISTPTGWNPALPNGPLQPFVVASNLYVASFAAIAGVTLKNPATGAPFANPSDAIVTRADKSEVKEWEALTAYIGAQAAANGGTLPARYNTTGSRRVICTAGPLCP